MTNPDPAWVDNKGTKWSPLVDGFGLRKVQQQLDIQLLKILERDEQTDKSLLSQIIDDDVLAGAILWQLCEEQAAKATVDETEFFKRFESSEMLEAAKGALVRNIADFSPPLAAQLLEIWTKTVQLRDKMLTQGGQLAIRDLGQVDLAKESQQILDDVELEVEVRKAEAEANRKKKREDLLKRKSELENKSGETSSEAAPSSA